MRSFHCAITAGLTGLFLTSCYAFTLQSSLDAPVLLANQQALQGMSYQVKKRFHRQFQLEYIFGASPQEQMRVNEILAEETGLAPHTGVINLRIERSYQFEDVLVSVFTLGIVARSLITVQGDVIIWQP